MDALTLGLCRVIEQREKELDVKFYFAALSYVLEERIPVEGFNDYIKGFIQECWQDLQRSN